MYLAKCLVSCINASSFWCIEGHSTLIQSLVLLLDGWETNIELFRRPFYSIKVTRCANRESDCTYFMAHSSQYEWQLTFILNNHIAFSKLLFKIKSHPLPINTLCSKGCPHLLSCSFSLTMIKAKLKKCTVEVEKAAPSHQNFHTQQENIRAENAWQFSRKSVAWMWIHLTI